MIISVHVDFYAPLSRRADNLREINEAERLVRIYRSCGSCLLNDLLNDFFISLEISNYLSILRYLRD